MRELAGQLGVARRLATRAVAAMHPAVEDGVPVVGLEPSCVAALRTDVPDLVGSPASRQVAEATSTLAELLVHHTDGWSPPRLTARSLSQTHCHQHATTGFGADRVLLDRMGVANTVLDSGCCGLAGNFGFEREHYGVSVDEYKRSNVLRTEVTSRDVAALACALAGPLFSKTTGAQIPVDGGNERVI